jgi:hypothetical protein
LTKSGGNVDLGGEKHDVAPPAATAAPDTQPPAATASAALPAVAPAASK